MGHGTWDVGHGTWDVGHVLQSRFTEMKINEKIKNANEQFRIYWSFEYFPPKTESGLMNLYERIVRNLYGFMVIFI